MVQVTHDAEGVEDRRVSTPCAGRQASVQVKKNSENSNKSYERRKVDQSIRNNDLEEDPCSEDYDDLNRKGSRNGGDASKWYAYLAAQCDS